MKSSDRTILAGVGVVVLIAIFWMMILSPKRQEASDLSTQVDDLQAQVTQSQQASVSGQQAKADFSRNYRRMIAIGKAVPADADTPSLLTELQALSQRSKVDFRSITLASSDAAAAPAATATATTASTDPALASESAAALLPIGATVGAAGLPVMPYSLEFQGGFFDVADFFGELDSTVFTDKHKTIRVNGRLLTIDGFSLIAGPGGFPDLTADVAVTTYLTPKDQGIAAGATPTGPDLTAPASTDTSTETAPATAATVGAN